MILHTRPEYNITKCLTTRRFTFQVGGDPFLAVVSYKGFPPVGWAMQISPQETINLPIVNKTVTCPC